MGLLQFNLELGIETNLLLAALAGLIGAAVMTIFIYLLRISGQRLNFPFLLGTFLVDYDHKSKAYAVGNILHLIIGAFWGVLYVFTLAAMGLQPTWPAGILWGFAHGIFIGVIMSTIGEAHPYMGEGKPIPEPGILGARWSNLMPYWILGLHIIFGVVTLFTYQLMFHV